MTTNQKENNIKKLIYGYTIETTPNVYEKFEGLNGYLKTNNEVYITYLPNEDQTRVINTAKKINNENLIAIPHLPARTIKDYNMLEKYIVDNESRQAAGLAGRRIVVENYSENQTMKQWDGVFESIF